MNEVPYKTVEAPTDLWGIPQSVTGS